MNFSSAVDVMEMSAAVFPGLSQIEKPITGTCLMVSSGGAQEVVRPLALDERMTALAAAISIDYDYFSQHSHGPGMMPGLLFPMPIPAPSYPDPEAADAGADGGAGAEAAAEAEAGAPSDAGPPGSSPQPGGAPSCILPFAGDSSLSRPTKVPR